MNSRTFWLPTTNASADPRHHLLGNDHALNFIGALTNAQQRRIAVEALDFVLR